MFFFFFPFAEYKSNGSHKNKCRFCSSTQRSGGWERGRGDTCPWPAPPALIHLLVGQRDFQVMGLAEEAGEGTVASTHLNKGARGVPHPSPESLQLMGRYWNIWPSKLRVQWSSRASKPGRRGGFWLTSLARGDNVQGGGTTRQKGRMRLRMW